MKPVKLIRPNKDYLNSYLEACRELQLHNELSDIFFHNPDHFAEWKDSIFTKFEDLKCGRNLPEGYVPASVFWLVEEDMFIGEGSIRHRLTPSLERFGGHISYAIRPSKWRMGYGTLFLGLLLPEARKLGIDKALITCDEDNRGSARVMEKNAGVYQDTVDNHIEGKPRRTKRYWIQL